MSPRWQAAIGYALVGAELAVDEPGRPDPELLVTELAAAGWSTERIGDHARQVLSAEQVWPHPCRPRCVPAVVRPSSPPHSDGPANWPVWPRWRPGHRPPEPG